MANIVPLIFLGVHRRCRFQVRYRFWVLFISVLALALACLIASGLLLQITVFINGRPFRCDTLRMFVIAIPILVIVFIDPCFELLREHLLTQINTIIPATKWLFTPCFFKRVVIQEYEKYMSVRPTTAERSF